MSKTMPLLLLAGFAMGWTGCGDGSTGGNTGVALIATPATPAARIDGISPVATGARFVIVPVTLQNVSVATPIPAGFLNFTLTTADSLVIVPSVLTSRTATPCPSNTMLAVGGHLSCTVAFELSATSQPALVNYSDSLGHTASALVTVGAPSAAEQCELVASWSMTGQPTMTCASCIGNNGGGPCSAEFQAYYTAQRAAACSDWISCIDRCDVPGVTGHDLCACALMCGPDSCRATQTGYNNCIATNCNNVCH